jgi:hypothetical protein
VQHVKPGEPGSDDHCVETSVVVDSRHVVLPLGVDIRPVTLSKGLQYAQAVELDADRLEGIAA